MTVEPLVFHRFQNFRSIHMITQSQIAEIAGVSRSTVGRVLNHCEDVNEETRRKVTDIIEKMNYHPNRAGKALVIKQKNIKIGCIIIQADNPFYAELNKGIQEKAEEFKTYGIDVIVERVVFRAEDQIQKIDELLEQNITALVIQPTIEPSIAEKLLEVEKSGIPIVTVNTDLPNFHSTFCYVGNDFYLCGKTAANLMEIVTGASCQIGIITGFSNAKSHSDRVNGFRDYLQNIPGMSIVAISENMDDEMESYFVTKTMLNEHPEINAMFLVAGGVHGAGTAIKNIQEEQHRSIKTISFDDVPTTRSLVRDGTILATICQQPIRQGQMALSVLFDYFVDGKLPDSKRLYTDIQIKIQANIDT